MVTAEEIEKKLREIKPYLEHKFKVSQIGYFGSFAEGNQSEESDLDLLVEFSTVPGWEFFALEEVFDRKVDLVTERALKKQLRSQILKQVKYIG